MITWLSYKNISNLYKAVETEPTLWIPIMSDADAFYLNTSISMIYIYGLTSKQQYVVGFSHNDLDCIDRDKFFSEVPNGEIYVYKWEVLRDRLPGAIDACMAMWFWYGTCIEIDRRYWMIVNRYKRWFPGYTNIVDAVPVTKLVEYCKHVVGLFKIKSVRGHNEFRFYHDTYLSSLIDICESGISINRNAYKEHFSRNPPSGILYLNSNSYSATGRPIFSFGGVTFSSLNKASGVRGIVNSRFDSGRLIEFDYDSYHIRLIGTLIGYDLPDTSVHTYFGRMYYRVDELSPDQYESSKRITFKQLYGDSESVYMSIDYFAKVDAYRNKLYADYIDNGFCELPGGRKLDMSWMPEMTPQKLFSYFLQSFETEVNSMILRKVLDYLYKKKSKLVLYTYDSFLIDYCPEDGSQLLSELHGIITGLGYPARISAGVDYDSMIAVTI